MSHLENSREVLRSQLRGVRARLDRGEGLSPAEARAFCETAETALGGIDREISRLYEAVDEESALRAHLQEFRRVIFEHGPLPTTLATLKEGRFIDVNDAFVQRSGYAREDVVGRTSTEIELWPDPETRARIVEVMRNDGHVDGLEINVRKAGGEVAPARFFARTILLSGQPCIMAITVNLEERRRAEEEALRLKQFYEDLLATLPAHIAILDAQGRYQYIAPNALPDPEARAWLLGRTILEYADREGLGRATAEQRQTWLNTVVERKEVMQFEERTTSRSGETQHYIRTYKPILDENGEVSRIIVYGLEVTELRRLEEQLRQAQKMEAVGRLAGGVAHDFNNLLTAVLGTADLLMDHLENPDLLRNGLRDIQEVAGRGASLTRQLLSFSRRQVAEPEWLDLNDVLRNMGNMLQRLIGEKVHLTTDLAGGLPLVRADRNQIEQVILNLAVNARDAMPRGGSLTLRTWCTRESRTGAPRRPGVTLMVSDTGTGISPDVLPHIFEPFFTTKEAGKGTGLGLPSVYAIVEGCGGQISVDSAEGVGTTFLLQFPATEAPAPVEPSPSHAPVTPCGTGTVLVAEDESTVRQVVKYILTRSGFEVTVVPDGYHAVQALQNQDGSKFDLLVTDMIMPGMSGRELSERVLAFNPAMKILFMSGHLDGEDAAFIARQEASQFLHKPFSSTELVAKVKSLIEGP